MCYTHKKSKNVIKPWINFKESSYNQNSWLKPYIDLNTDLTKIAKNDFEKDLLKVMNNAVFEKTMKNVRNHRGIKLVITKRRGNYLVSEPNFLKNLLVLEMKKQNKTKQNSGIFMDKPVYLGLSILN